MFLDLKKSMPGSVALAFWWLALATQMNLNHFFNMMVGTGWFITVGITLCGVFLLLAVRGPLRRSLGAAGYLYVAAMTSYLTIGWGVAVVTGAESRIDPYHIYYATFYVGLAILLATATALTATMAFRRIGVEKLLAGILAIQTVTCIAIIFTPVLLNNIYSEAEIGIYRSIALYRAIGTFADPNLAAALACQTVVLALALTASHRYRKFAAPATVLAISAAYLTQSRTGVAILVVIGVFFLLFRWSSNTRGRVRASYAAILLMAVGLLAVVRMTAPAIGYQEIGGVTDRFAFVRDLTIENISSMPRVRIWPAAMSLIAESPIVGNGLTQALTLAGSIGIRCGAGLHRESRACGSHNTYLMFWGESGIAPLILSLLFIGFLLRMHLKAPRSVATDAGAGWVIVLAMQSMTYDGVLFQPGNAFVIGLTCAMAEHSIRETRADGARRARSASRVTHMS